MQLDTVKSTRIDQRTAKYIGENIYAKNTISSYQYDLKVFTQWRFDKNIKTPTLQDIIDFFQEMKKIRKISTLNRYQAALSKIYNDIMQHELFIKFFQALNR